MTRTLFSLEGNTQRLDGGAMFGNAPKAMWQRWVDVDEENRIPLACRSMLIKDGDRNILCEVGVGAFFEPKMRVRYGVVEEEHVLLKSLADIGLSHEDIDVVVLSHLHFDHAGGLLSSWSPDAPSTLLFPNATFVFGKDAWDRALRPHPRDRASFIPHMIALLSERGNLEIVDGLTSTTLGPGYRFHRSDGHTPGMLLLEVDLPSGPVVFGGDLVPGRSWVHAALSMGYDRYPELAIDEKKAFLTDLIARDGRLFYTHDPSVALSAVTTNERGKFVPCDEVPTLAGWSR